MTWEELLLERELPEVWSIGPPSWEERRQEIKMLLQENVYGFLPGEPDMIRYRESTPLPTDNNFCAGKAWIKRIEITVTLQEKEFTFPMCAVIPKIQKRVPFFVHINFRNSVPDKYMPTEEIVDNGFAIFSFCYKDVTSDDDDFTNGLAGIVFGGKERGMEDCGKIGLWSWAASRVMDYCQSLDCLDFQKAAVVGHSRLGKTALVTGMMDERYKFVISNDSGCAGAAISRGKMGESVKKINDVFPFWFARNYRKFGETEDQMPFDQHFLLAASAPRYVYVASAEEDLWADPISEYLSCCAASLVYERLGEKGFIHTAQIPAAGSVYQQGNIGYHIRKGCHYLSREDWNYFMQFMRSK